MKPKKDFYSVGEILGPPPTKDPNRPNLLKGATPERLEPQDYPLFHGRKHCRVCDKDYLGLSMSPQYDDDPPLYGWCGCPMTVSPGLGPWNTPKPKTHYSTSQRPQREGHDLYA